MKKIINSPNNVVTESIDGLVSSTDKLLKLKKYNVVVRSDIDKVKNNKVSLIIGGGDGHNPEPIGFIGESMISAAVCGQVFSSPSSKQVLMAIKAVTGNAGSLLIVKNYTGDRLNFGIAREMSKPMGYKVGMIIVDDDISSILMNLDQLSLDNNSTISELYKSISNRRGIAGSILVYKLLGALADQGKSLDEIIQFYNEYLSPSKTLNLCTMGVGLSSCIIPVVGKPTFSLLDDEMEMGLGIHGEFGIYRSKMESSNNIVISLIDNLIKILPSSSSDSDKSLVLFINNLGSTTNMEISIVINDCLNYLNKLGYNVERLISGTLMTSLEMAGISISLLLVKDNSILNLIDYPTNAISWPTNFVLKPKNIQSNDKDNILNHGNGSSQDDQDEDDEEKNLEYLKSVTIDELNGEVFKEMIVNSCNSLLEYSDKLTELDSITGDGDLGTTMKNLSNSLLSKLDQLSFIEPCWTFRKISMIILDTIGGTSGILFSIFFLKLSNSLYQLSTCKSSSCKVTVENWGLALLDAANSIREYGKSEIGDCTMLDSLIPAINQIKFDTINRSSNNNNQFDLKNTLKSAFKHSEIGANTTITMIPKKGRSAYLGERSNVIDPGAFLVSIIFKSFLNLSSLNK